MKSERGSALLMTALMILMLTALVLICMNESQMMMEVAHVRSENTTLYHLAESSVKEQVDYINEQLNSQMPYIISEFIKSYSSEDGQAELAKMGQLLDTGINIRDILFTNAEGKVVVKDEAALRLRFQSFIYGFISKMFIDKGTTNYKINSETELTISYSKIKDAKGKEDITCFQIEGIVEKMQENMPMEVRVIGKVQIDLADTLKCELDKKYEWRNEPIKLLSEALISFSEQIGHESIMHTTSQLIKLSPEPSERYKENTLNLEKMKFLEGQLKDYIDITSIRPHEWSYENPVLVVDHKVCIDLDDLYVMGDKVQTVPSIIINLSQEPLIISGKSGQVFRGIIISYGPIKVQTDSKKLDQGITMIGTVIAGSRVKDVACLELEGKINWNYDANMLFDITCQDKLLYQNLIDLFQAMQYEEEANLYEEFLTQIDNKKLVSKLKISKASNWSFAIEEVSVKLAYLYKKEGTKGNEV